MVPQKFRDEIRDFPVKVTVAGAPEVTKTCTFCGIAMNSSEWDEHMVKHVHTAMADLGKMTEPAVEKRDANTRSK